MLKGIDTRQRIEFSSKHDTTDPKTVFVLKPMTSLEKMEFSSKVSKNYSEALQFYLEKSIVSVSNFDTENVREVIDMLDMTVLDELVSEINRVNNLSGDEIKNS